MKNNIILLFVVFFSTLISCQELTFEPDSNITHPKKGTISDVLHLAAKTNYKEDYRTFKPENLPRKKPELILKHRKSINGAYDNFIIQYPSIKEDLVKLQNTGELLSQTVETQNICLRSLRKHFLSKDDEFSLKESKFLLDILIESKAVDLDVLADTYVKVKGLLNNEEATSYLQYLQNRYIQDKKRIKDDWEPLKAKYENAETTRDKEFYLMKGKNLERISKELVYSKEILPEIVPNLD